jgi:CheY-like chemotaxis protein
VTSRVLVVEDEAIAAMAIRMMLESMGCTVLAAAASGREAVDLALELQPDLVLMDIRLKGGMTGIESAQVIREHLQIPIIFTTAYSTEEIRATCAVDDSFLFVTKPIQESELARAVSSVCRRDRPGVQR